MLLSTFQEEMKKELEEKYPVKTINHHHYVRVRYLEDFILHHMELAYKAGEKVKHKWWVEHAEAHRLRCFFAGNKMSTAMMGKKNRVRKVLTRPAGSEV